MYAIFIHLQYQHSNCKDYLKVSNREHGTSTGTMLNLNKEGRTAIPTTPTATFSANSRLTYDSENPFSYHDNRNRIQLTGEYLGDVSSSWSSLIYQL